MAKLLQINSSLHGSAGQSTRLADAFSQAWMLRHPEFERSERTLTADTVPHLTAQRFAAFSTPAEQRTPEQAEAAALSDNWIAELRSADVIVLALPMYNFGVPSTLKAYFDHIARAGVTFRYTESGPEGLLPNVPVYVLAARGGNYQGTALDTQTGYVRSFLNFLGLKNVKFVYAEGLGISADAKSTSLDHAHSAIERLAA